MPGQYAFDVIVLCASDYQPDAADFPGVDVLHTPFDDTLFPSDDDVTMAMRSAHTVLKHLQAGRRVLVTCWAGQNRSAFVAAMAMKRKWRAPTEVVVKQIRDARPNTLHNSTFIKILSKW
jgi:protein-tyrosine phosphatase